jgi:hypothetical protein
MIRSRDLNPAAWAAGVHLKITDREMLLAP